MADDKTRTRGARHLVGELEPATPEQTDERKPRASSGTSARGRLRRFGSIARARLGDFNAALRERVAKVPILRTIADKLSFVTPFGWALVVIAAVLWWVALRANWIEPLAIAALLTVTVLLAILWALGHVSYDVEVGIASDRIVVGESGLGRVVVANNSTRTTNSSTMELPVGTTFAQFHIPRLSASETDEQIFTIPTKRRGVITVGPASSVRGDGLGILRKRQDWNEPAEIYIHPRTTRVPAEATGFIRDIEGTTTQDLSSSDVSFHALRDYVPGDDRRNIHWKTTARTGRLMVRQFEETRRAHLLVILDCSWFSWKDDDEFELGVSAAASLGGAVLREQKELTVYSQHGPMPVNTGLRLLDEFTLIERTDLTPALSDLTRQAVSHEPSASVITIITGSEPNIDAIHKALLHVPTGTVAMVLRVDRSGTLERKELRKTPIITLPHLEGLPAALFKAAR